MTTIEELRKKYGDSPQKLKELIIDFGDARFQGFYFKTVTRNRVPEKVYMGLRDGGSVEVEIERPTEGSRRNLKGYFQLQDGKILFFENWKHVSDFKYAKDCYEAELRSLRDSWRVAVLDAKNRIPDVEKSIDHLNDLMIKAETEFRDDIFTSKNQEDLERKIRELNKLRMRAAKNAPDKPDKKSFIYPLQAAAPIRVSLDDLRGLVVDSRQRWFREIGVVPVLPMDTRIRGSLWCSMTLK